MRELLRIQVFLSRLYPKKHNAVNYHIIREAAAASILRVANGDSQTNLADPLTKFMPYSQKNDLLGMILYDY